MGFSLGWYYMRLEDGIDCVIWKWRQIMGSCRGCLVGGTGFDLTKMMMGLFGFVKFKRNLVSGAYIVRQAAKSIVASGLARSCIVQVSYAIGVPGPLPVLVDSYGFR
ncbi:hypothetical protein MRB53_028259 [Persea americana]|uniref:Uncharacterized protein n=1 Tax=Persea americana TaxID=3435 RepID=A0ACC2KF14_PERAE|nr:hypothetical protein MRB53_028259 [Persea americana]